MAAGCPLSVHYYSLAPLDGESILAWLSPETLLVVQLVVHVFVTVGIGWACLRLGGRLAAAVAIVWWIVWPSTWDAVTFPYYYYWPIPCTVGLACLWLSRGLDTRWTLPLLVGWAQFRMTAVGTFLAMPKRWHGVAAYGMVAALLLAGHGRTQVWHDLYIGIGAWPNPYGIVYQDESAIAFAAARGVAFKAPGYEALLRDEYLRIARSNPLLIARNTALNFGAAVVGGSFWGGTRLLWAWVPAVGLWWAWRQSGVYRALVLVWLAQCATLGFVNRPQEAYLWETMGLFVIVGSVGLVQLPFIQECRRAYVEFSLDKGCMRAYLMGGEAETPKEEE